VQLLSFHETWQIAGIVCRIQACCSFETSTSLQDGRPQIVGLVASVFKRRLDVPSVRISCRDCLNCDDQDYFIRDEDMVQSRD